MFGPGSIAPPILATLGGMAPIADASVIVEAGDGSGTFSQGWETLRIGRPLFLLKSLGGSALKWRKEMIDHGAMVLTRTEDLLDILPTDAIREAVSF